MRSQIYEFEFKSLYEFSRSGSRDLAKFNFVMRGHLDFGSR